jgi:hypothetical protein
MTSSLFGWLATSFSAGSYLSRQGARLKKIQAAAACLWIIYGVSMDEPPVIVANLIVAAMALCSAFAERSRWKEHWFARLSRQSGRVAIGYVATKSRPSASHTAMVVSTYSPVGVTESTSDLVMFSGSACDRVRPQTIDF